MNKDLDDLWDVAWFNDINDGGKSGMLYCQIVNFCSKWEAYAPRLCQWLFYNQKIDPLGLDECKALFATEIQKAERLFSKAQHKKEILEAGVAFHV